MNYQLSFINGLAQSLIATPVFQRYLDIWITPFSANL